MDTVKSLTDKEDCGILKEAGISWDDDDLVSFHFQKGDKHHRHVFFRIRGGIVFFLDPGKKIEVPIGYAAVLGSDLVIKIPMMLT